MNDYNKDNLAEMVELFHDGMNALASELGDENVATAAIVTAIGASALFLAGVYLAVSLSE